MSPAGQGSVRASGEWAEPVTQGQFKQFTEAFTVYCTEDRKWKEKVDRQLSDGQTTMALLRSDAAEARKKSDEASSKIRLLAQNDAIRTDRDLQMDKARATAPVPVQLPAVPSAPVVCPPEKPTFWQEAGEQFRKQFINVVVIIVFIIAWQELRAFAAKNPTLPGLEGVTPEPPQHERRTHETIPASAPAVAPAPHTP